MLSPDSEGVCSIYLDSLVLAPAVPVAMPNPYWLPPDQRTLSSQVLLLEPSTSSFARIQGEMALRDADEGAGAAYDMGVLNSLFANSAMVLSHRGIDLMTDDFRSKDYAN